MSLISNMVAAGNLDAAALQLAEEIRFAINTDLSREDFYKVFPKTLEILTNGIPKREATPNTPGDDIVLSPSIATLRVKFVGPEDDDEFEAPDDYVRNVAVGSKYTFAPYTIIGYEADQDILEGKMTAKGVELTVTYTKKEEEEQQEEQQQQTETPTTPKAKHTLTVQYTAADTYEGFVAPNTVSQEIEEGAAYEVTTPTIEGYTADQDVVSGTMSTADVTVTVVYTKEAVSEGTTGQE